MQKEVFEVLEEVKNARARKDKVKILQKNESGALRDVLRGATDKSIVWLLPEGDVPYTPNKEESIPSTLLKQCTQLAYFVKGGTGEHLKQFKRESMFIGLLESVHPEDAKHLVNMINKKLPVGVSKIVVELAFPGLIVR